MTASIELLAVIASAIYGILLAMRKGMDVTGLFAVGLVVAFGGGTLRDLFLDRHPLFWIEYSHLPLIVLGICFLAAALPKLVARLEPYLTLPDALGMGLFTIVGTRFALDAGTSMFIASLMGVITGTFGGVLADVIVNEVPRLFRPAPLCAICAFTGAWVYLGMRALESGENTALISGVAVVTLFRVAAVRWKIGLRAVAEEAS